MPAPRSSTSTTAPSTATSIGVSAGLNFDALSTRFDTARSSSALRPSTRRVAELDGDLATGAAAVPRHDPFDQLAEVDRLHRLLAARVGGELHQLRDEIGELAQLESVSVDQLGALRVVERSGPAQEVDVGAQRGERRAQLVAGVHHEPLLLLARRVQRVQHRVEARGQPAELVAPLDLDGVGEVLGLGDVVAVSVSCSIGRTVRRAITHASDAATMVPASAMSSSRASSVESTSLSASTLRAICTAPRPGARR